MKSCLKYLLVVFCALFSTESVAQVWMLDSVGYGTKSVMEVDQDGNLHVVHVDESLDGFLVHIELTTDSLIVDTITKGYFYGPADIAFNNLGEPAIVVYNHHPGNLGYCIKKKDSSQWDCRQVHDHGHDGWDARITFDSDNHAHVLAVDPANDGIVDGVEYYEQLNDTLWVIDSIGVPVLGYGEGVSIALDEFEFVHTSVFRSADSSLYYSTNQSGQWVNERIDSNGTGLFSKIIIDEDGEPRIWSFQNQGDTAGMIIHHYRDMGQWVREVWDTLYDVEIGFNKAIDMIDVAMYNGLYYVSYADRRRVCMAWKEGGELQREKVALYTVPSTLGQQTSIAVNAVGEASICYSKMDENTSLRRGEVIVANRQYILSLSTMMSATAIRLSTNAYSVLSSDGVTLSVRMNEIRIFDLTGKSVKMEHNSNHISTSGLQGHYILEFENDFRIERARLFVR